MAIGFTIERVAYRPLRYAPRLAPLITAIGVSIVLQQLAMLFWGRNYHTFRPCCRRRRATSSAPRSPICRSSSSSLPPRDGGADAAGEIHATRARHARHCGEHPDRRLMGVNINQIISITFIIGSALGALAGLMVSANYSIAHNTMGAILGLKAFTAAVLGGIGNLAGAMVGGLLLV